MPWWGEIAGALGHNDLRRWQIRARYFRMNRKKSPLSFYEVAGVTYFP
jgi:hypothetical protein